MEFPTPLKASQVWRALCSTQSGSCWRSFRLKNIKRPRLVKGERAEVGVIDSLIWKRTLRLRQRRDRNICQRADLGSVPSRLTQKSTFIRRQMSASVCAARVVSFSWDFGSVRFFLLQTDTLLQSRHLIIHQTFSTAVEIIPLPSKGLVEVTLKTTPRGSARGASRVSLGGVPGQEHSAFNLI